MSVEFTQDAEVRRVQSRVSWEFLSSLNMVQALRTARDLGWKEKKVQVRVEQKADDVLEYIVEPYEKDCGCKGILRYRDYFD